MPWNAVTNIRGPQGPAGSSTAVTRSVTYAASLTIAANSLGVDRVNVSATGNLTLTPSGSTDGQVLRVNVLASGGQRTVTFATAVRTSSALTRTLVIPSGQIGIISLEYSSLIGAWVLTAATVSST